MKFSLFSKVAIVIIIISLAFTSIQIISFYDSTYEYNVRSAEIQTNTTINALNGYFEDFFTQNVDVNNVTVNFSINRSSLFKTLSEKIDKFMNFYTNLDVSKINIVLIDNGNLTIFVSSDYTSINKTPDYKDLCEEVIFDKRISFDRKTIDNNNFVVVAPIITKLNNTDWCIGAYEIFLSSAYSKTFGTTIDALILIFLSLLITFMILILFGLRKIIIIPLQKMLFITKKIGKGNFDVKIDLKSRDEIGDLASAFDQMAKDLKESRAKIEDYNRILENLLEQKDEFIGQLGHDLKNPLQPLVGLLPVLIENEKDPKTKEILEIMNQNVEYMRDLIFDTLELAKLRHSNIEFDFEDLNLHGNLENVLKSEKLMLEENNIKVENRISKDIYVWADKLRLSEIFKNLITNSVKYKKEKSGNITIGAIVEKEFVKIYIRDDGIGMTEEQLKKVFDEFYKADKSSSDKKSTGLGLSICKKIVEKHGGKIWVESGGLGNGSTFYFTLKISKGMINGVAK